MADLKWAGFALGAAAAVCGAIGVALATPSARVGLSPVAEQADAGGTVSALAVGGLATKAVAPLLPRDRPNS